MAPKPFSALRSRSDVTGNGASHQAAGDADAKSDALAALASRAAREEGAPESTRIAPTPAAEKRKKLEFTFGRGFKREDRILFCRQLATFVRSGVPLLHAMGIILNQTTRPVLREAYASIIAALQRGDSLSATMQARPKVFPRLMADLVQASERTGRLDIVLSELATHYERDLAIRRRVKQALTYPMLVLGLAIVVVLILVAFVMPAFVKLFEEFEAQLPFTARLLMGTSRFLGNNWYFVVLGLMLIGLTGFLAAQKEQGKRFFHRLVLRVPVAKRIMHLAITARWARTLSSMVRAGVPMITALHVAQEVTANRVYQEKLEDVAQKVAMGRGLSAPLQATGLFPDMVRRWSTSAKRPVASMSIWITSRRTTRTS